MTKLIVVLGGTGIQGGSVIDTFIKDPGYKVRTVNRNPGKAECKALTDRGVEVVKGSYDDVESLKVAVKGANVVFGVTDYWAAFQNPATRGKLAPGQLLNEYCYDLELQQGKNIADAVATIVGSTLDLYVWSSLSHVRKWSKGRFTWVYHFDSKAMVYEYIKESLPQLAKKTSTVQIGFYATNWKMYRMFAIQKAVDGEGYEWRNPAKGENTFYWVDARCDTGKFVRALTQTSPGKDLLGVSQVVSYQKYIELWGKVNNVPARYVQIDHEETDRTYPEAMKEIGKEGSAYITEFGWDGGEGILRPKDLKFEEPLTTVEEYIKGEDWSSIIK